MIGSPSKSRSIAAGIVQHDFGNTVKGIREAIRRLRPWADATHDLVTVYDEIQNYFEHLDGYRRCNRIEIMFFG